MTSKKLSTFQTFTIKMHSEALKIIDQIHGAPKGEPDKQYIKDFYNRLQIPPDMYRILFRELYEISKGATGDDPKVPLRRIVRAFPKTSDPVKKYYMIVKAILRGNHQQNIWQLKEQHTDKCLLCKSCRKRPCDACAVNNEICSSWNCNRCDECEERIAASYKCKCHNC